MTFVIPNVFSAGDKAVASQVNENFEYLKEAIETVNTALDSKIETVNSFTRDDVEQTLKTYCDTGLAQKANTDLANCTKPYVTETYTNGDTWYRVYSDGFIEQGGRATNIGTYKTITYPKAFTTRPLSVNAINSYNSASADRWTTYFGVSGLSSATSFNINSSNTSQVAGTWYACGY